MKSFFVLASLVACVFAQRLHINTPTNGQGVPANTVFTVELKQDEALGPIDPGSVVISVNECYNVCAQPDQWGPASVLYNGPFNPQPNASAPTKGLYQDFTLDLPPFQPGEAILQVAHTYKVGGATLQDVFDYSYVPFNVQ